MTHPLLPRTAVIVVAAGSGTRLGEERPKAFVDLGGQSILRRATEGVAAASVGQIVLVVPDGFAREAEAVLAAVDAAGTVVTGGDSRQASVAAGLAAVDAAMDVVLVHDAARALTPPGLFATIAAAVTDTAGVIPALPVVDTIKRFSGEVVGDTVDRSTLLAVQTPQGFPRALLAQAYEAAAVSGVEYTDDAALFAAAGFSVRHVAGAEMAFKITTPADLARARAHSAGMLPRVGVGTDVHAFGGAGSLWLAGLEWPGEPALSGHSDGDAVAHAIVDAVLSAAGLGDIGTHFGTDRPEFAGAHADVFLAETARLVAAAGLAIGNVSVQFQGNRPRFAGRRAEAERALSDALGAPVSVSATTTDGLGFAGRGEGIAATAMALLHPLA